MRTDRLLAETIYLLSHGRVPARKLAERFEVSVRTILRDMDALGRAGIPIISFEGSGGGFALEENYRLDHRAADKGDMQLILVALHALSTAVEDQKLRAAIEKFQPLADESPSLAVDLSALQEDTRLQENLTVLRSALRSGHAVHIKYVSVAGRDAWHVVEPIKLQYQWYSWYLLAYSRVKQAVLTYKLVRMDAVEETDEPISPHPEAKPLADVRPIVALVLRVQEHCRVPVIEYLHARPEKTLENGDTLLRVQVPADEMFWRGVLMALGDGVQVLSPPEVIDELRMRAQQILLLYPQKP